MKKNNLISRITVFVTVLTLGLMINCGDDENEGVSFIPNFNSTSDNGNGNGSNNENENSAPTANSQSVTTLKGKTVNITLTASDPDDDPLTWHKDSDPQNGSLDWSSAPDVIYSPEPDSNEPDNFEFHVNDGNVDSNITRVTITIEGKVLHVTYDPLPGGDGLSWETAYDHPQYAAEAAAEGDQIWVAGGTYFLREAGDNILLIMREGVDIYGGFKGDEADLTDRDYLTNITMLDGENVAAHVVSGADNARLDGFTITGGNAENYPDDKGGGVYYKAESSSKESPLIVANCVFIDNSADEGGGMYVDSWSSPIVNNCEFKDNSANNGGGLYIGTWSYALITNCAFNNNSAIENNYSGGFGGGICNGSWSSLTIANCIFKGNSASYGGGMCNDTWGDIVTATNSTFSNNTATQGGGIYNKDSEVTITNCILWGNTPKEIEYEGSSMPTVTYSNIQGGYGGTGNLDDDPLFKSASDLHLQAGSPCIDKGINNVPELPDTDFDGSDRITDGDSDDVAIVDMGAYEYQPVL